MGQSVKGRRGRRNVFTEGAHRLRLAIGNGEKGVKGITLWGKNREVNANARKGNVVLSKYQKKKNSMGLNSW